MVRTPAASRRLTEWAVLGLLCEQPAHGWDLARSLAPDGDVGQVWTVSRPLVYRAVAVLRGLGYVEERETASSASGTAARPARSDPPRPSGVATLARARDAACA